MRASDVESGRAAVQIFALQTGHRRGVFFWMLLGRKRGAKEVGNTEQRKKQTMKELGEARALVLPEPALSVTEHTTRSLDLVSSQHRTE